MIVRNVVSYSFSTSGIIVGGPESVCGVAAKTGSSILFLIASWPGGVILFYF